MITLHIEHAISNFSTWRAAFEGFTDMRTSSGVRSHTVWQPLDDPTYVLIDLNFDTAEQAERFRETLQTRVWGNPENSPALEGAPITRILEVRETTPA